MNTDTREMMSTAMDHNRKLMTEALKSRELAPAVAPDEKVFTLGQLKQKAFADAQFKEKVKQLQQRYAGKLTPERMQAIHNQGASDIQPGASMSPSSAGVIKRALSQGYPSPSSGTLEPAAPFLPSVNGIQVMPTSA